VKEPERKVTYFGLRKEKGFGAEGKWERSPTSPPGAALSTPRRRKKRVIDATAPGNRKRVLLFGRKREGALRAREQK